MLVQYLVGLCCLRWDKDAVDVTVGDMVLDTAAGKKRDVDVTVTIAESDGAQRAFKAYEVKREGEPLDVADVEALCLKLLDMPSITHRAIVSSSGFTAGAQTKAAHHGVELFAISPWTRPLEEQFPNLEMRGTVEECFPMSQILLRWTDWKLELTVYDAKGAFRVSSTDALFDARGGAHKKYLTFSEYQHELLLRSTEALFPLEPASTLARTFPVPFSAPEGEVAAGPAWPHTHTLEVANDGVCVDTANGRCRLDVVTINGYLRWERSTDRVQYYIMEGVPDGHAFAGALIASELREGHMTCLVVSPNGREIGIHFVRLTEKQLRAIRKLKL